MLFNAVLALVLAASPVTGAEPMRILAFGNSLVAGWGLGREESFPAQLERALRAEGYAVEVMDGGVSGDTTAGGRARLAWTLGNPPPDAAIVELGANDGLRGLDPAETYANLDWVLGELARRGVPTLLTGMLAPPNMGREYGDAFRDVFTRLADEHDVLFYPFFLDGVAAQPALNQVDGMHPNAAGVAVIVERITPSVKALIRRAGAGGDAATPASSAPPG